MPSPPTAAAVPELGAPPSPPGPSAADAAEAPAEPDAADAAAAEPAADAAAAEPAADAEPAASVATPATPLPAAPAAPALLVLPVSLSLPGPLGLDLRRLTEGGGGALIQHVAPASQAFRAGLRPGDGITRPGSGGSAPIPYDALLGMCRGAQRPVTFEALRCVPAAAAAYTAAVLDARPPAMPAAAWRTWHASQPRPQPQPQARTSLDAQTRTRVQAETELGKVRKRLRKVAEERNGLEAEFKRKAREEEAERREKARKEAAEHRQRLQKTDAELKRARAELAARRKEDNKWNVYLAELLRYRAERGDCLVPRTYDGGTSGSLGYWVKRLRSLKRSREAGVQAVGDREYLTDERIQVLDAIGFQWTVQATLSPAERAERWEGRFAELVEYKRRHGHCRVPQRHELGMWVKRQRDGYKAAQIKKRWVEEHGSDDGYKPQAHASRISDDQIDRLNELGFVWYDLPQKPLGWDAQFEELMAYRNEHGHCNVPQSFNGRRKLGRWVMRQRELYWDRMKEKQYYRGSGMTDERVAKLEGVGFLWRAPGYKKKSKEKEAAAAATQTAISSGNENGDAYGGSQDFVI